MASALHRDAPRAGGRFKGCNHRAAEHAAFGIGGQIDRPLVGRIKALSIDPVEPRLGADAGRGGPRGQRYQRQIDILALQGCHQIGAEIAHQLDFHICNIVAHRGHHAGENTERVIIRHADAHFMAWTFAARGREHFIIGREHAERFRVEFAALRRRLEPVMLADKHQAADLGFQYDFDVHGISMPYSGHKDNLLVKAQTVAEPSLLLRDGNQHNDRRIYRFGYDGT